MKIAFRELLRRPGRFSSVGGALTLLVLLLIILGGFLDGLELSQTGSYRVLGDALISYDDEAELLRARSQLDADVREQIGDVDGVARTGGVSALPTTAGLPGSGELIDVVAFGYDTGTGRLPPPPVAGEAVVDGFLADVNDVAVGDMLTLGTDARSVRVTDIVDDATEGSPTVWLADETWREIAAAAGPGAATVPGTDQLVVAVPEDGVEPAALAQRIDEATGATTTVTVAGAIDALPVVQQQSSTFEGIIGVTFVVSLLVVALFFALITLERRKLYAVLKALGATSRDLLGGVTIQALGVTLAALVLGGALAAGLVALVPPELPLRLEPARVAAIAIGTLATSVVGGLFTLRRLLRIDPAESIG